MMPNVLVTSHQAFLTHEALRRIAETTLGNLQSFFNGEKLENEIEAKKAEIGAAMEKAQLAAEVLDVTMPGKKQAKEHQP